MNRNNLIAVAACALALSPLGAAAQTVTYTENFTGANTVNSWNFVNGACLTAGSSTSLTSPGPIPSCVELRVSGNYYNKTIAGSSPYFNNTSEPLIGGNTGTLPDSPTVGGALRFTDAGTVGTWNGSVTNGLFENGGILSNFSFPLSSQGVQVTFTTETYDPGYGPGYNYPTYDGSDGISFFLQDASQFADIGATGGSLAYSCSNQNLDPTIRTNPADPEYGHQRGYDGIPGGYIGLGIDEYGNFLNGAINITGGTDTVEQTATYSGLGPGGWDNSSTGYGWVPNRIGLRGAGNTNWHYLTTTWPSYYPSGAPNNLTDTQRNIAVLQACITGFVWNYSGVTSATSAAGAAVANPLFSFVGRGSLSGSVLTVSSVTSGQINVGDQVTATGVTTGTTIASFKTGSGGTGTYNLSAAATTEGTEAVTAAQYIPNPFSATPVSGTKLPYNYPPLPNAYKVLSGVQIANETALYRGTVTPITNTQYGVPITYNLTITTAGLLSLSYSYNGGAYQSVISNQNITSGNGPLPAAVRFGFAGSQGGVPNTHELMCFQAAPQQTSQSSAGLNQKQSAQVQTGSQVYFSYYTPSVWSGDVTSQNLTYNGTDVVISSTANWDASCVLTGVASGATCLKTGVAGPTAAQGVTSPSRTILSWNGTTGIPFEWSNLTAAEQSALDTGDGSTTALRLNYLRGDRTQEQTTSGGGIYRDRVSVLGDVVDSSPTWVGPPNASYPTLWKDALDGGTLPENSGQTYAAFTTAEQTRTNVVYAGANDGMLHGFRSGSYSASNTYVNTNNDGLEVLAYVPGYIVDTIEDANSSDDYSNPQYGHHFDVDAPPGTGEVFFGSAWHTWLVGGLGPGGNAIYALDITTPGNFSEANASSLVVGEWSTTGGTTTLHCAGITSNATTTATNCGLNLGNTYGVPQIRRFHNGEWGAVFGNGFGSSTGDAGIYVMLLSSTGTPSFYYLSTGTSGKTNGIAYTTPADLDGDHIVDYVYAGDLNGNIWRFDLTSTSPSSWGASSTPLFTTGTGQPITSKVVVASILTSPYPRVLVEFGTGQQVPLSNTAAASYSGTQQYLYGVWDWNMVAWNAKSSTTYASLTSSPGTLGISNLQAQSITNESSGGVDYRAVTNTAICWEGTTGCTEYGWYVPLTSGHTNASDVNELTASGTNPTVYEQVIYSPVLLSGAFVVNTTIPPSTSLANCSSTAAGGWTLAIDPSTGGAFKISFFGSNHTFVDIGGQVVSGEALSGTGTPSMVTYNGQSYLVTQNVSGTGTVVEANPPAGTKGSRLTWIEKR